jgi:hypothetical protein
MLNDQDHERVTGAVEDDAKMLRGCGLMDYRFAHARLLGLSHEIITHNSNFLTLNRGHLSPEDITFFSCFLCATNYASHAVLCALHVRLFGLLVNVYSVSRCGQF